MTDRMPTNNTTERLQLDQKTPCFCLFSWDTCSGGSQAKATKSVYPETTMLDRPQVGTQVEAQRRSQETASANGQPCEGPSQLCTPPGI